MSVRLPKMFCKRCGHSWYPRKPETPKVCPKCKSPYWMEERKRMVASLLAALLLSSFLFAPAVSANPSCYNSFTLRIGRLSMRCTSNLLELLVGKIESRDVVMENLYIEIPQDGGTLRIFVSEARSPYAEMQVSFIQTLVLAITHLFDLVPLLLGRTVTWTNVTIVASYMYSESLLLRNQRIWAGRGEGGYSFTADAVSIPSLSIDNTLGDNRFVVTTPQISMENIRQELGGGFYLIAPRMVGTNVQVEAVSVFSPLCTMSSMEVTERTRTRPHRVVARGISMQGYSMGFLKIGGESITFPDGFVIR